jgi:hypothetical protein
MFINAGTVKTHLAHVYAKLDVANPPSSPQHSPGARPDETFPAIEEVTTFNLDRAEKGPTLPQGRQSSSDRQRPRPGQVLIVQQTSMPTR